MPSAPSGAVIMIAITATERMIFPHGRPAARGTEPIACLDSCFWQISNDTKEPFFDRKAGFECTEQHSEGSKEECGKNHENGCKSGF